MKKKFNFSRRRFLGTTATALTGLIIYPLDTIQSAKNGKLELIKPVTVSSSKIQFLMSPVNGAWQIRDNISKTIWHSNPFERCFGEAVIIAEGKPKTVLLSQCQISVKGKVLTATFHPLENDTSLGLRLTIRPGVASNSLTFSYEADPGLKVENISLLNKSLWTTGTEQGYVVIPSREGLFIPADSGLSYKHRFDTYAYEGCHMTMAGIVKGAATAVITWEDPYTAVEIENQQQENESSQVLTTSFILSKTSKSIQVQFCGNGDYNTIAQAYGKTPGSTKWKVPWAEKIKKNPENAKLLGASNIKLWSALTRRMNPESTQEISKRISWSFDEAAQVAEHFKNDVQIDNCLFTVGGWIHRGYDNQHPDILPPAPECGGAEALADCSNRVMKLGYLFCLHDNYQDIYKDSPSWDENYIMKKSDGSLAKGGAWNGGTAYLTCSKKALELAKRPQNLPAVKKITNANSYFIDTTYAAGLQECYDINHPLTRSDDMYWKQAISDYAREVFGIFGSECGREWALPHADFFEGLTGVNGRGYHDEKLQAKLGATVIPVFEAVYRDGIAMYGKYGFNINDAADYVLQHIIFGRPLNYHNIPSHLYWKEQQSEPQRRPQSHREGYDLFVNGDNGWSEGFHPTDKFIKNTHEILGPLNAITAQLPLTKHSFLSKDRKVQQSVFGDGPESVIATVNLGFSDFNLVREDKKEVIVLPSLGFMIDSPGFIAFYARNWNGIQYDVSPLFTIRSMDNKPIDQSEKIRIFHGFGDTKIKIGNKIETIQKEVNL